MFKKIFISYFLLGITAALAANPQWGGANSNTPPFNYIKVSAGSSHTLQSLNSLYTTINWNSGVSSAKTLSLKGCTAIDKGAIVEIKDGDDNTSTYPLTITPISGTIGAISSTILNRDGSSVRLICNGISDWTIAGSGVASLSDLFANTTAWTYYARDFGSCDWVTAGADVGPCINLAINFASTMGGGTVILPVGSFSLATTIVPVSKVKLEGAGYGGFDVCATKFTWTGASGGIMVSIGTDADATIITNTGMKRICFNGGPGIAGYGVKMWTTTHSTFEDIFINNVKSDGGIGWYMNEGASSTSNTLGNTFKDVSIQNCNDLSIYARGWVIGGGTDTQDVARNTWIGGISNGLKGDIFTWGGSDANVMYGGAYQPCNASRNKAASAVVSAGGAGYTGGDIVTITGCTLNPTFSLTVVAGAATAATVVESGWCPATPPANPIAVTGGTGTGATLTITYALGSGYGMIFSGQAIDAEEHSRGNMLYGTIIGAGGSGGTHSYKGGPGLKAAQDNVLYGFKTEDGEPAPTCEANPAAIVVTGNTNTSTTIDGIASTTGIAVGMIVSGSVDIDPLTTTRVVSVAANSIVVSRAATGTTVGVTLTIEQPDVSSFRYQQVDGNLQACDNGSAGKWRLNKGNIVDRIMIKTANYVIKNNGDDSGYRFTNEGAAGSITFFLPEALASGKQYCFERVATQALVIKTTQAVGNTNNIRLNDGVTTTAGPTGSLTANTASSEICLIDSNTIGSWRVKMANGIWFTDTGVSMQWGTVLTQKQASGAAVTTVNNSTTFADITGLTTIPLITGKKYICSGKLRISASNAAAGAKVQIASDGTLTATTANWEATNYNGTTINQKNVGTGLAATIGDATAAVTSIYLDGVIDVGVGGNLKIQIAQNVAQANNLTVGVNSPFGCDRVN